MAAACHRHNPPPVDLVPLARQARGRVRIAGGGKQWARVGRGKRVARTRKITARSQSIDPRRLLFVYGSSRYPI